MFTASHSLLPEFLGHILKCYHSDNSWTTLRPQLFWPYNFLNYPTPLLCPFSQTALIPSLVNVDLWFSFSSSAFFLQFALPA